MPQNQIHGRKDQEVWKKHINNSWEFAFQVLDDKENMNMVSDISAGTSESFFTEANTNCSKEDHELEGILNASSPQLHFNDEPISTEEI